MAARLRSSEGRTGRDAGGGPGNDGRPHGQRSRTDKPAPALKRTIALVYDFDGTLSPRPMQEYTFLPKIGEDAAAFWAEVAEVARREEADGLITYMHLMYKKAKARGVRIDREELVALGRDVELFEGVTDWFDAIGDYVQLAAGTEVELRHYLVSSGLKEIIEGTPIYPRFHNVFASEYFFEAYELPYPKRVITDTGKTQYLFRINKGIEDLGASINSHMPEADRPVPFENMIYFGDGDTDVPSMTVMRKNGGHAIAVHPPGKSRRKCVDLYRAGRVDFLAPADYRRGSDLFRRTCLLIDRMIAGVRIAEEQRRLERSFRDR
ncbi:MAG: HAD family hydrolase [Hyphomicrobiaceae bacterium]